MTEPDNTPVPPPPPPIHQESASPPAPQQGAASLREELARLRSGNKTLKIVAGILIMLFVLAAGAGYIVYQKISALAEPFTEAFQAFPQPPAASFQRENPMTPIQGSGGQPSMKGSSLGLLTGGLPGGAAENTDPAKMQRIAASMNKYAQRPVVKEFLAELEKDPDVAAAMKDGGSGNPMSIFAAAQNSRNLNMLMMKYATRPDFMKTMIEIANDPDLKSMAGALRGGPGLPVMPQSPARRVSPAPDPSGEKYQDEEGGAAGLTLDQSVVSGPAAAPSYTRKTAPPPVDSE